MPMRVICALLLILLFSAIGIFAWQNQEAITLKYLNQSVSSPLSLLIGIVYGVGMVSGGAFIGFVRRSFRRVTERSPQ
jgi:uncharacterized integral membrane protein